MLALLITRASCIFFNQNKKFLFVDKFIFQSDFFHYLLHFVGFYGV